jgi:hypothetical protein
MNPVSETPSGNEVRELQRAITQLMDQLSEKPPYDTKYAESLSYLAAKKEAVVFNNRQPMHASIVMEHIFRETRKSGGEIRIYGRSLNGEISHFDHYRQELIAYLFAANTKIKVIVDEAPGVRVWKTNAFDLLSTFAQSPEFTGRVEMRQIKNPMLAEQLMRDNFGIRDVHFAVSSENMYRFEIDSNTHFAECSFNGKERAERLTNVFDTLFYNRGGEYTAAIY